MPSFSVEKYNDLLGINEAHDELCNQLDLTGASLNDLITDPEITKLFMYGDSAYKFGICILHRHYSLKKGERMVSSVPDLLAAPYALITEPSDDTSSTIYADRWMPDGDDFEHTIPTPGIPIPTSPPPAAFFEEFRRICARFKVDILGICVADLPVGFNPATGLVFLEGPDGPPGDRRQRTTLVPKDEVEHLDLRQAAWVPVRLLPADVLLPDFPDMMPVRNAGTDETQKLSTLSCVHNCTNHLVPLRGPTITDKIEFKADVKADIDIFKSIPLPPARQNPNYI